jgi:hypothetical protein
LPNPKGPPSSPVQLRAADTHATLVTHDPIADVEVEPRPPFGSLCQIR